MPCLWDLARLQGVCHCFIQGFFTFFICLEYDCFLMDPTATRVYQHPALIVLERLILSCYLAYPALQSQFDRGFRSFTVDSETPL